MTHLHASAAWLRTALCVGAALMAGCRGSQAWYATSPDDLTRLSARQVRDSSCVEVAGRFRRCDAAVNLDAIALATRGGAVAYAAQGHDGRWVVVRDGGVGAKWIAVGAPVLTSDGAHLAYAASDGTAWRVVLDERPGVEFDAILEGSIVFDRAGRRLAYAARRGDSVVVVLDGEAQSGWDAVGRVHFSGDGERSAYIALLGGKAFVVMDGVRGRAHSAIGELAFSASGRAFAYAARDEAGWTVQLPAAEAGPFIAVRNLAFRIVDGRESLAFVARSPLGEAVVIDGRPHRWHAGIRSLAVAPEGSRWGYITDRGEVFIDGDLVAGGPADELVISPDGARWAYVVDHGDGMEVVHDNGGARFDLVVEGTLQFMVPEGDGRGCSGRWAVLAGDRDRRQLVVAVEGVPTGRSLGWTEVVRLVQRRNNAAASLRAWVAIQARLATCGSTPRSDRGAR